jgi:hypothetical protein
MMERESRRVSLAPDAGLSLHGDSMSTTTTLAEKGEESITDTERADTASDGFMVGIDAQGREHYFSPSEIA